jgi:hypothetical protein
MEDVVETMRRASLEAVNASLPAYPPERWLAALKLLVANRAAPNTAPQQAAVLPDLGRLSRSARFGFDDGGLRVVAAGAEDVLTRIRRGSLWFRGGDPEAELLTLLGEVGS